MQGIYLSDLGLKFVKTCFTHYSGSILFIGIFFAGILLFLTRKNQPEKCIATYTIFLFLTIFNPVLVNIFFRYVSMDEVYYRFFWLLPINLVIAYLFVTFSDWFLVRRKKLAAFAGCVCIVIFLGSPVITASDLLNLPDNLYKISDEVLEISEFIHADTDEGNPKVAISSDLLMVIRQYDASLFMTLNRDYALCWNGHPQFQYLQEQSDYSEKKAIMDVLYAGNTTDTDSFIAAIESTETDYLIFSKSISIQEYLKFLGITYVTETNGYYIYNTNITS